MQGKTILVTGANGFVGRVLCGQAKTRGAIVRALLRTEADGPWDEAVFGDLADAALPRGCMEGVDTVFHLAGKVHTTDEIRSEEAVYQQINVDGTQTLLDAAGAANVRQFIFISSVKAMGEGDVGPLDENSIPAPVTAYGRSKLMAEHLVLGAADIPKALVIRPAMIYGPGNPGNLGRIIAAIRKGYFPPWPKVANKRSMVHVDDLVCAVMLAYANDAASGQIFVVTDGQDYSTRQIYEWICASLDIPPPQWSAPLPLLIGLARIGDAMGALLHRNMLFNSHTLEKLTGSSEYNSSKIRKMLGFEAGRTLEAALPEIVRIIG